MNISRINYLRGELENEVISQSELAEIEAEFAKIPDEELRDVRENATASDMLDEIGARVAIIEKTLYNWVYDVVGADDAKDPCYDLGEMAEYINALPVKVNGQTIRLGEFLERSYNAVG